MASNYTKKGTNNQPSNFKPAARDEDEDGFEVLEEELDDDPSKLI
jgi:hypothetical protein